MVRHFVEGLTKSKDIISNAWLIDNNVASWASQTSKLVKVARLWVKPRCAQCSISLPRKLVACRLFFLIAYPSNCTG